MRSRGFVTILCVLSLVALAGCEEQCGTEWETRAQSPNGNLTARVHEEACAATVGFGPSGYEQTRVDILDRFGRQTTVVAATMTDDVRPRASWISDDAIQVVVSNYIVFDKLTSNADGVAVSILFDPPDPAERTRWLSYFASRRAYERAQTDWLHRKYDLRASVGPAPAPPPPFAKGQTPNYRLERP